MMRNQQKSSDGVRDKSVKFNPETIETSIGGTNSAGQINVTLSSNISTDDSTNDYSRDDDSLTASSSFVSSSDSSTGEVSVIYRPDGTPSVAKAVELFSSEQTKNKLQTNRAAELRLAEARKQKQADANRNKNTPSRQNGTPSSNKRSVTTAEARSASSNRRSVVQPAKVVKISTPTQSVGSTKSVKSSTPQSVHQKRQFGRSRHGYSMDCSTLDSPVSVDRNSVGNTSVIAARRISELGSAKKPRISSIFQYDDSTCVEDATCSGVTVAVRVKPYSQRDLLQEHTHCVVSMVDNETVLTTDNGNVHRFTYDYSFWSYDKAAGNFADQCHVYETLAQPMLSHAFEGYNVCLFAYGQTGSGKSYSIMGHHNEIGIIPRFCEELFGRLDQRQEDEDNICKTNVEISFFEIYNEKIHDLLGPSTKDSTGRRPNLKVREHPRGGPFVEGLSSHPVKSFEDINGWLTVGNKLRATAATGMNDKSSRSHSVFTMIITKTQTDTIEDERHEHSITSKVNLIDLAGSERQSQARTSGERLREGASINKSLMTLGKVISLLSETSQKKKKIFIPYRDSVLTWLLKESIGGNSKTAMLATISPSNHHQDETLSTLRYAKQARSIMNQARVNEDPKARLIRELRSEIEKLKCKSGGGGGGAQLEMMNQSLAEITSLKSKLRSKEQEMAEMAKSWSSRLQQSEERKLEESRLLEKSGVSLNITSIQPSLVNLNEDPQLNEMLLYLIKEGVNRVGLRLEGCTHDIQLSGALIAKDHCTINNVNGVVSISTVKEASTYVNGSLITQPTILHHGDRVIIGGDHYFRFNHAKEVAHKGRSTNNAGQLKDFEFARQELLRVQEERFYAKLKKQLRRIFRSCHPSKAA